MTLVKPPVGLTSNYTLGKNVSATDTILDNDIPQVTIVSNGSSVTEGGKLAYTVNLTNASDTATTVTIQLSGSADKTDFLSAISSDANVKNIAFNSTSNTVTFSIAAGQKSASFEIVTKGDGVYEGNESVVAKVTSAMTDGSVQLVTNANAAGLTAATQTILDADLPKVSIAAAGATSVTEGQSLSYSVALDHASKFDTKVTVQLSGANDFSSVSGVGVKGVVYDATTNSVSFTIAAGVKVGSFSIVTANNSVYTGDTTVTASVSSAVTNGVQLVNAFGRCSRAAFWQARSFRNYS
jgi:hypothetical protein